VHWVRGAAEAIRATDNVDAELVWESDWHALFLGHLMGLCDHNTFCRGEVLVVITRVRASNAIARSACDVE
jgi:hypothetical protein